MESVLFGIFRVKLLTKNEEPGSPGPNTRFMEAHCHIFLINLVYRFLRFDIPSISLDILGI